MEKSVVQALESPLASLERELKRLERDLQLIRAKKSAIVRCLSLYGMRSPFQRGHKIRIIQTIAKRLIANAHGGSVKTAEIIRMVQSADLDLEGKYSPSRAISAALSGNPDFKYNGKSGWTLTSQVEVSDHH